jgi:2-oxoglutarate dehydrogenase E2 component (dihydrolipoamide succinyltransferase)
MDVVMPQLGETVTEGTVARWHKKAGDPVRADETLFEVETDKVSMEIPAPASGVLAEILVAEGTTVRVGTRLAVIEESAEARRPASARAEMQGASEAAPAAGSAPERAPRGEAGRDRLSPAVRRLLAEHGLDAGAISGTGRDGRIKREDVLAYLAERTAGGVRAGAAAPGRAHGAETEIVPLNAVRKRVAERMAASWASAPHVLQAVEADYSRIEQARREAGAAWKEREGFSLTYLPFVARAAVLALAKYPRLNASFGGDHLVVHRRVNLGIAVDLGFEGLVVPVVRDAGARSLAELARAIHDLARRARENRLRPDDLAEGTYTISNNGAFGTVLTAPIVNPPQVAILSTDAVRRKPVVVETGAGEAIAIRPVGVLAQTFDHRAVDGAYSAAFLSELKTIVETHDWMREIAA